MSNPIQVFYSYAHKDENFRDELAKHLSLLRRQGVILEWHDRQITAGEAWEDAISANLEAAQLILLLISPDFMHSDYCYGIEMHRALEKHKAGKSRVIPIIVRPVDWSGAPFGYLQALPQNAKPITKWRNRDEAWLSVAEGIRKAVKAINEQGDESDLVLAHQGKSSTQKKSTEDEEPPDIDLALNSPEIMGDASLPTQPLSARSNSVSAISLPDTPYTLSAIGGEFAPEILPISLERLGFKGWRISGRAFILPPMIQIPAGRFSFSWDYNDAYQVSAETGRYWIGKYPVTVAEFNYAVEAGGVDKFDTRDRRFHEAKWDEQRAHPNYPVRVLTWNVALAYVNWLEQVTGWPWRLPIEEEWEKAARGMEDKRHFPWGDAFEPELANVRHNGSDLKLDAIASHPDGASPFGVMDMAGGVWEATNTRPKPSDVPNDTYERRIFRGGCYKSLLDEVNVASRFINKQEWPDVTFGMRIVLSLPHSDAESAPSSPSSKAAD